MNVSSCECLGKGAGLNSNHQTSSKTGFLLTSQWHEGTAGTELEFWFSSDHGPLRLVVEQPSVCFIKCVDQARAEGLARGESIEVEMRTVALQSFNSEPLLACYLRQEHIYHFHYALKAWDIKVWEYDLRPTDRYLMERFVRGSAEIQGHWRWVDGQVDDRGGESGDDRDNDGPSNTQPPSVHGHWQCRNGQLRTAGYQPQLKTLSIDIETSYPRQGQPDRLFSIAWHGVCADLEGQMQGHQHQTQSSQRIWMIDENNAPRDDSGIGSGIDYVSDEASLLQAFFEALAEYDPDVIIGWNFIQFDMMFIQRKCDELEIDFIFGRHQQVVGWRQDKQTLTRQYAHVAGRCIIDGIEMLRQAQYQFDSFALDFVAEQLLGRNKLITSHIRGNQIEQLFADDKPALAAYNLEDCVLVWDIFEHTELMAFAIERSQLTGLLLDRMGGSVAAFENLYLPKLHRAGYVAPNYGEGYGDIKSPGGFVMESRPGLYDSVLVLDFKSLYPSIMRTFKIDPMGLIEGLKNSDVIEADIEGNIEGINNSSTIEGAVNNSVIEGFNGGRFDRHQHCLPELISGLGEQRDQAKRDNNHPLAQAIKIIMSSFYGVLGSEGCRFFDVRLSSSITLRSHEIIQRSASWIETQGYDVIYGDTDSVFVWLKAKHTQAQADVIGQRLSQGLNAWWRETLATEHALESLLEIEYETHYQRFFYALDARSGLR